MHTIDRRWSQSPSDSRFRRISSSPEYSMASMVLRSTFMMRGGGVNIPFELHIPIDGREDVGCRDIMSV